MHGWGGPTEIPLHRKHMASHISHSTLLWVPPQSHSQGYFHFSPASGNSWVYLCTPSGSTSSEKKKKKPHTPWNLVKFQL